MKVGLFVDASQRLGLGHLYRNLHWYRLLESSGVEVVGLFVGEWDEALDNTVSKYRCFRYKQLKDIGDTLAECDVVFVDHNYRLKYSEFAELQAFANNIRQFSGATQVFFDDYFHRDCGADVYLMPYPCIEASVTFSPEKKYLYGLEYMFFQPEFYGQEYPVRDQINRILIVMGGTDLFGFTEKILGLWPGNQWVEKQITVVTGPNSKLTGEALATEFPGLHIEFVRGTSRMDHYLLESDLAVVNSGLVKYEAAFLGVPCITLSNRKEEESLMQCFSDCTGNIHVGPGENLQALQLEQALEDMTGDKRTRISLKSKQLFEQDRRTVVHKILNAL